MAFALDDVYGDPEHVAVTAHRGFSGQYPENTVPAFMAAVALGVDLIEFDLRGTRDGVPIVLHDGTFNTNVFYGNTDEDNRGLIASGVQGILTDHPDVLIATLQTLGRR